MSGGHGRHSGQRTQHGDEAALWGPTWESERKEARAKARALSLRAWHAVRWNWLCPECSGSPCAQPSGMVRFAF